MLRGGRGKPKRVYIYETWIAPSVIKPWRNTQIHWENEYQDTKRQKHHSAWRGKFAWASKKEETQIQSKMSAIWVRPIKKKQKTQICEALQCKSSDPRVQISPLVFLRFDFCFIFWGFGGRKVSKLERHVRVLLPWHSELVECILLLQRIAF